MGSGKRGKLSSTTTLENNLNLNLKPNLNLRYPKITPLLNKIHSLLDTKMEEVSTRLLRK